MTIIWSQGLTLWNQIWILPHNRWIVWGTVRSQGRHCLSCSCLDNGRYVFWCWSACPPYEPDTSHLGEQGSTLCTGPSPVQDLYQQTWSQQVSWHWPTCSAVSKLLLSGTQFKLSKHWVNIKYTAFILAEHNRNTYNTRKRNKDLNLSKKLHDYIKYLIYSKI